MLGSGAEIVSCLWEERSECVVASSLAISGGKGEQINCLASIDLVCTNRLVTVLGGQI